MTKKPARKLYKSFGITLGVVVLLSLIAIPVNRRFEQQAEQRRELAEFERRADVLLADLARRVCNPQTADAVVDSLHALIEERARRGVSRPLSRSEVAERLESFLQALNDHEKVEERARGTLARMLRAQAKTAPPADPDNQRPPSPMSLREALREMGARAGGATPDSTPSRTVTDAR